MVNHAVIIKTVMAKRKHREAIIEEIDYHDILRFPVLTVLYPDQWQNSPFWDYLRILHEDTEPRTGVFRLLCPNRDMVVIMRALELILHSKRENDDELAYTLDWWYERPGRGNAGIHLFKVRPPGLFELALDT